MQRTDYALVICGWRRALGLRVPPYAVDHVPSEQFLVGLAAKRSCGLLDIIAKRDPGQKCIERV